MATTYRHPAHDQCVANLIATADAVAARTEQTAEGWIRRGLATPGDAVPGHPQHPVWRAMYEDALAKVVERDRTACPDCRAGCYQHVICSCASGCAFHPYPSSLVDGIFVFPRLMQDCETITVPAWSVAEAVAAAKVLVR